MAGQTCQLLLGCLLIANVRGYVKFEPPKIYPNIDHMTVKTGQKATFSCEGSLGGVSWRLPIDATNELRNRVKITYYNSRSSHVSQLVISDVVYTDTSTLKCVYNGTTDVSTLDNSSSIHLYVEDPQHLLKHSGFDFLQAVQSQTINLPCLPTHPDVNITLRRDGKLVHMDQFISFDPKVGYRISPVTIASHAGDFLCTASFRGKTDTYMIKLIVRMQTSYLPPPHINRSLARHVRKGDPFTLTCAVTVDFGVMVELTWTTPNPKAVNAGRVTTPETVTRNLSLPGSHLKVVEQALTVHRATREDQGTYECTVQDHSNNNQTKSEFVRILEQEEAYVRIYYDGYQALDKTMGMDNPDVQWVVQIEAHPQPTVEWYGPDGERIYENAPRGGDFTVKTFLGRNARTLLRVNKLNLSKAGSYMVKVFNANDSKTENFSLTVRAAPQVEASVVNPRGLYTLGHEYTLTCSVKGYPLPDIKWLFTPCSTYTECDNQETKILSSLRQHRYPNTYSRVGLMKEVARRSGVFICQTCNKIDCNFAKVPFFVTDVPDDGFAVEGHNPVLVGDPMRLKCSASVYNFTENSMEWYKDTLNGERILGKDNNRYEVVSTSTNYSFSKELLLANVSLGDKGRYVCRAKPSKSPYNRRSNNYNEDPTTREKSFDLTVLALEPPVLVETNLGGSDVPIIVNEPEDGLLLQCRVGGRPRPQVTWLLNGAPLGVSVNTTRVQIADEGQLVRVNYVSARDEGVYECSARNRVGRARAHAVVQLRASADRDALYSNISVPVIIAVSVAIILVLLLLCVAKLCYNKSRSKSAQRWKDPPTPPTPRLTQFELPLTSRNSNDEDDECRMTLTSVNQDSNCDGSIRATPLPHPMCHCHMHPSYYPAASMMPKCSICDFSAHTLPMNYMGATLGRPSAFNTLRRYHPDDHRSRSQSPPRLSAEF